jgi:hypothetical protein
MSRLPVLGNVFALPAILLILNLVDVLTTNYGLSRGLIEINPLFSYAVIPGKFLGCGILFTTSYLQSKLCPKTRVINDIIISIIIAFYVFVVLNNILAIIRLD